MHIDACYRLHEAEAKFPAVANESMEKDTTPGFQ